MFFNSDDAQAYYEQQGSGMPLVLLHPFPVNHGFWSPVAKPLAERYRVILPDLRAHGESGVGHGPATMRRHAEDLARLCDAAGAERAIFCGASIGGYILFEFWRRYRERVRALVLCVTKPQADAPEARTARLATADEVEGAGTQAFVESMIPKLIGESTRRNRPDLVAEARRMMQQMKPAGVAAAQRGMAERPDSTATLRSIQIPTLVVAGGEDTLIPPPILEAMSREIIGSKLAVIPAAGHYAPFEQPDAFLQVLMPFLDTVTIA
jgi:3-oxoadipate enol-lactonase